MRYTWCSIVSAALLAAGQTLYAGDGCLCYSSISTSCDGMRISACPSGDFEPIAKGCGGGADYILVQAHDGNGPVPGIPPTDYWFGACDPSQEICLCSHPVIPEGPTDNAGVTYMTATITAGGCVISGGIYLVIQGVVPMQQPGMIDPICLDITMVSPDLNADCVVNLSDLAVFGFSYNTYPPTNMCCDYNDDGYCNLSDFAYIGAHYQHRCE